MLSKGPSQTHKSGEPSQPLTAHQTHAEIQTSIGGLSEHLASVKVGQESDSNVEDLTATLEAKWAPNRTHVSRTGNVDDADRFGEDQQLENGAGD